MSEADDRFLETLAVELAPGLGPRLPIVGLDLDKPAEGGVRIIVTVGSSAGPQRMVEAGESLTDVAAGLLRRAPEMRLAEAFREIVEPART